jgi:hypothetical protein
MTIKSNYDMVSRTLQKVQIVESYLEYTYLRLEKLFMLPLKILLFFHLSNFEDLRYASLK